MIVFIKRSMSVTAAPVKTEVTVQNWRIDIIVNVKMAFLEFIVRQVRNYLNTIF